MKQILKKLILLTAVAILCGIKVHAQPDPFYPLLLAELRVTGGDTLPDGDVSLSDTTLFDTHMILSLYDTTNISRIHVILKKNPTCGGSLLVQSYDFNTVQRDEYTVDLELGNYKGMLRCYGEAVIEKSDGSMTQAFKITR